jgi:hypothetical protein
VHVTDHAARTLRRGVVIATAAFAFGAPQMASAAEIDLPQLDDPTVIALSIAHGPSMGSLSCYQFPSPLNCNDTNPVTVGCSADATTVLSTQTPIYDQTNGAYIGYLELRYSQNCGTNWARSVVTNPAYVSPIYQRDTFVSDGTVTGRFDDRFNDQSVRYSAEVYAPMTRECASITVTEGPIVVAQVQGACG